MPRTGTGVGLSLATGAASHAQVCCESFCTQVHCHLDDLTGNRHVCDTCQAMQNVSRCASLLVFTVSRHKTIENVSHRSQTSSKFCTSARPSRLCRTNDGLAEQLALTDRRTHTQKNNQLVIRSCAESRVQPL